MNYTELLRKVADHIYSFYTEHPDARLFYHNYVHVKEVSDAAKKIADHYQLNERDWFIICTATLFHDIGYLVVDPQLHEGKSAVLAEDFLKSVETGEEDIAEIKKCIIATKMPQSPVSLPEKIVCDADLFYLGTDKFKENSRLLKKEIETVRNIKISGEEWRTETIKMLESHHYHTDYCLLLLESTKRENIEKLKRKQQEKEKVPEPIVADAKKINSIKKKENINKASQNRDTKAPQNRNTKAPQNRDTKEVQPNRDSISGIQTMFKTSSANSLQISAMADDKAHIMISVNSIIISIVLGLIARHLEDNDNLIIPTIILLLVNITTIVYSVLATRPKILSGMFRQEQVENKKVNLLFFGSFYKMSLEEYREAMRKMMGDTDFLYGSLIKDIYWQGKVLGRKYRLLRTSYSVFMYGIVASVIAFAIAAIFFR